MRLNIKELVGAIKKPPLELALYLAMMETRGESLDTRTQAGKTILHIAARYPVVDTIKVLVAAGADPNAQCNRGETPLITACAYLQAPVARALLESGADVNKTDMEGWSPLLVVCDGYTEDRQSLLDLLLEWKVDIHHKSSDHWTARLLAECLKDEQVRDTLLAKLQ